MLDNIEDIIPIRKPLYMFFEFVFIPSEISVLLYSIGSKSIDDMSEDAKEDKKAARATGYVNFKVFSKGS